MKSNFISLFFKVLKFGIILFLVDFIFGFIAKEIYFNQKTGKQARITYSINNADSQILIFGSSHANRHYIPEVFEKELNKTCYNAGVQGQGIIFHNVLQKIILNRTKPELIILNIDYNWLYENNSAYERLSDLYPYYWNNRDIIKPSLSINSKLMDYKLLFKAYQFNSTLIHAIRYFVSPQKDFNGYLPLSGEMQKPDNINGNTVKPKNQESSLDSNFILAFRSFIHSAKENNIRLQIILSPNLENRDLSKDKSMIALKSIIQTEKITLINLFEDAEFRSQYHLFNDKSHLNDDGAIIFSKKISKLISNSASL